MICALHIMIMNVFMTVIKTLFISFNHGQVEVLPSFFDSIMLFSFLVAPVIATTRSRSVRGLNGWISHFICCYTFCTYWRHITVFVLKKFQFQNQLELCSTTRGTFPGQGENQSDLCRRGTDRINSFESIVCGKEKNGVQIEFINSYLPHYNRFEFRFRFS